ncbi:unnamed protein product [Diamesa serratosioi]
MSNEPVKVKTEDNFLLSSENLRSSPELWPEKIEGSDNFTKNSSKMGTEIDCSSQLTQNDIRMIYQLGSLDRAGLITEIRRLYDEGYQLGLEEAKEITRGKYLNIFTSSNSRKAK